jgi:hypothetical protein
VRGLGWVDRREHAHPSAAPRARENIDREDAPQQLGPGPLRVLVPLSGAVPLGRLT